LSPLASARGLRPCPCFRARRPPLVAPRRSEGGWRTKGLKGHVLRVPDAAAARGAGALTGLERRQENERLREERERLAGTRGGGAGGAGAARVVGAASAEALRAAESKVARLETKLSRAFSAEELVRLPALAFRELMVTVGAEAHRGAALELSEAGLAFSAASGAQLLAVPCETDVQVAAAQSGFTVSAAQGPRCAPARPAPPRARDRPCASRGWVAWGGGVTAGRAGAGGRVLVESKYSAVLARLVKLWMAYKREKRRLQARADCTCLTPH